MKGIYTTDFLLCNTRGKQLYHGVAAALPIIDPHNHIDPSALAQNRRFENIYRLWVQNDPYKHRAMRICGVAENLITGNAPDYDKFLAWAECLPHTVGNPLFHWCGMELKELFGIKEVLTPANAKAVWDSANKKLLKKDFGAMDVVKKLGVEMLCTSDDLLDSLEHHQVLAKQNSVTCLPSLRGDSMVAFNSASFGPWMQKLAALTNTAITDLASYKIAILKRLNFFDATGCLLADHSLDGGFAFIPTDETSATALFKRVVDGDVLSGSSQVQLQSYLIHFLGVEYAARRWKLQLHIGAHRYTSSVLRKKLGPAGGYAGIGNAAQVESICLLLDSLDKKTALPQTILYTLNPADNAVFATLTGSFAEDGVRGKIQFGPAWWYNDHYEGITQQLQALSSYGLLATSIGMTTDSRSLLSFVRHNYYRRILCNLVGSWMHNGVMPDDMDYASGLIKNICYNNIKNWMKK